MGKLFFSDKPVIGIDINLTSARAMVVDPKKQRVYAYGTVDLDPAKLQESFTSGKSQYLATQMKALIHTAIVGELPSKHVVIGIPTQRTFSRTFMIPNAALKTLREAVEVEAERSIPIPLSSLYLDYEIIEKGETSSTILMTAAPTTIIDNCIQAARDAHLYPIMLEPRMHGVARLLQSTEQGNLPTVIIDIGPADTDIAVLDGTIRVTGGVGVGSNTFTLAIASALNLSLEQAHQLKVLSGIGAGPKRQKILDAITPTLRKIVTETQKVSRYYSERIDADHKIEQILVVGNGSNIPGIGEYFTDTLTVAARVASPWQELDFSTLKPPEKQLRTRYVAAAGLALVLSKEVLR